MLNRFRALQKNAFEARMGRPSRSQRADSFRPIAKISVFFGVRVGKARFYRERSIIADAHSAVLRLYLRFAAVFSSSDKYRAALKGKT